MRRGQALVSVLLVAGALTGCGTGADVGAGGSTSEGGAVERPATDEQGAEVSAADPSSSPMSPSSLPTMQAPTAPPSEPTDSTPTDVLAGRITALTESCTEVTTDDEVWSLVGSPEIALEVGDTVTARIAELGAGEEPCGEGLPARLVSIRVVA